MERQEFERALARADALSREGRAAYWLAYKRGLQRGFFGHRAVTNDEHDAWLDMAADVDPVRSERGRGYCDGVAAVNGHDVER